MNFKHQINYINSEIQKGMKEIISVLINKNYIATIFLDMGKGHVFFLNHCHFIIIKFFIQLFFLI